MGRLNYVGLGKILVALQQVCHCARKVIFPRMVDTSPPTFSSNSHQGACLQANHLLDQAMWPVIRLPSLHYLHFYANTFYFISPARILFTKFINWNLEPQYLSLPKESIGMRFPFSLKTWFQVKTLVKSLIDIKPPLWLNNSCSIYDETLYMQS